jgi:hypothetical protein
LFCIMSFSELVPPDPAALAEIRAEQAVSSAFEVSSIDHHMLAELDHGAELLGFINQSYFVQSFRALVLPSSFEAGEPVPCNDFFGLTFEGRFATYAKVCIGRIIGANAVRAVCLTFSDTTLLPTFEELPDDKLLFVPALAITSMEQV